MSVDVEVQDSGSGVETIELVAARNVLVEIPKGSGNFYNQGDVVSFTPPETNTITVYAEKADQNKTAYLVLEARDAAGNATVCDPVYTILSETVPVDFDLKQNYPNPFNPTTTIHFDVAAQTLVKLTVFDVLGREVKTIVNKDMAPGKYSAVWDGRNEQGELVAGGLYIYRIKAGRYTAVRKMVLLK